MFKLEKASVHEHRILWPDGLWFEGQKSMAFSPEVDELHPHNRGTRRKLSNPITLYMECGILLSNYCNYTSLSMKWNNRETRSWIHYLLLDPYSTQSANFQINWIWTNFIRPQQSIYLHIHFNSSTMLDEYRIFHLTSCRCKPTFMPLVIWLDLCVWTECVDKNKYV